MPGIFNWGSIDPLGDLLIDFRESVNLEVGEGRKEKGRKGNFIFKEL